MATKPMPDTAEKPAGDEPRQQKKNYVPEGYKDAGEFLAEAREIYRLDREADRHNTDAALDDLKFASADIDGMGQWDSAVLKDRDSLGQPSVTNNFLPMIIGQVVGDRRLNQTSIKVLAREDGDVDIASVRSDLIRNIEVQSRAPQIYSRAFEHAVTCGIGNIRVELDWTDDDAHDRDIFIRGIANPLSVVWDYMAIDPTGRDAGHCFVEDVMPRKQFDKLYPDQPIGDLGSEFTDDGWLNEETVRTTEYWRMIERRRVIALFRDQKIVDITDREDAQQFIDGLEFSGAGTVKLDSPSLVAASDPFVESLFFDERGPRIRQVKCKYAQMHLITSFAILEGPYELKINRVPIVRCSGREFPVGDKRIRFGIIRFIKENQRLDNLWDSIKTEILSKAPRQQWIGPADAFEGYAQAFRDAHITGDPILKYNPKAASPPQPVPPVQYPTAFATESAAQKQRMKDGSGIHDASLGIKSNETSGVAIRARQSEGDVATVIYHDNADAMIAEAGDIVNQLIPQVYDVPRTIRIIGADQEEKLVRINDPMNKDAVDLARGKYDITISTGPAFQTRRQEAQAGMVEAIRAYPPMMEIAGPEVIKAMDWPNAEAIAELWQDFLVKKGMREPEQDDEQAQQNPEAMMAQQQAAMAMHAQQMQMRAELSKAASEAREAEANAVKAEADAMKAKIEARRAEMEMNAGIAHHLNNLSDAGQPDPASSPQPGRRDPARKPGRQQRGRR